MIGLSGGELIRLQMSLTLILNTKNSRPFGKIIVLNDNDDAFKIKNCRIIGSMVKWHRLAKVLALWNPLKLSSESRNFRIGL